MDAEKKKIGRPAKGRTTTKCSFTLNTEVLEDLKIISDSIGVTRSAFLSMLLAESLPQLKQAAAILASGEGDPVDVAYRYGEHAKEILERRMAELRGSKNGKLAS